MNEQAPHVLLVEDDKAHAELARRAFEGRSRRVRLTIVDSLAKARACLAETRPDLIIADLRLPDGLGTELLPAAGEEETIPLVVMTGQGDEETAVESMRAGALDYVVKSAEVLADLPRVAERALREWRHIAERHRAEQALRESEARIRAVVDGAADAIITYDEHGIADSFNPAAERIFGYAASEIIGRDIHMLMPDSHAEEHDAHAANHLGAGRTYLAGIGRETLAQRRDGSAFSAEIAVSEYFVGERRMFAGIVRDITERKQLEAQFLQAQKMEAFGQLAGGVAHDFNNLLTAIINFTYLAAESVPQEGPVSDYLGEVQSAAERASRLTTQLLAFSRRQVIQPTVLNPNEIIMETDKMLRRLIGEDVELVTLGDPELGFVKADPGQLEQVLTNLAVNARDAMPDGGKLVIETANVTLDEKLAGWHPGFTAGEYIMLSVTDTGVGMTEEVQTHAFEPFFTTKEVDKGTGLGLSTCYGIVRQSGGHIEAQSQPGQGTTFRIYLPRVEREPSTLPVRDDSGSLPGGRETVLLVEDEPLVQQVTAEILRAQGYDVLEAANGTEAMQVVAEHAGESIHLLLTDVVMPLMGGTQLAQQVTKSHPETKALYMSGYVDDTVVHQHVREKRAAFLQKPFTAQMLARRVRETLDQDLALV